MRGGLTGRTEVWNRRARCVGEARRPGHMTAPKTAAKLRATTRHLPLRFRVPALIFSSETIHDSKMLRF